MPNTFVPLSQTHKYFLLYLIHVIVSLLQNGQIYFVPENIVKCMSHFTVMCKDANLEQDLTLLKLFLRSIPMASSESIIPIRLIYSE